LLLLLLLLMMMSDVHAGGYRSSPAATQKSTVVF
jgi:hypothetical protein